MISRHASSLLSSAAALLLASIAVTQLGCSRVAL